MKQSGFTLIELVMVIVILGILAVTVIPKLADLSGAARHAKISQALSSMKVAGRIVHSAAITSGVEDGSISLEGEMITVLQKGIQLRI